MNTSKVTSEFRAAQWMQIIQDRQASGMNVINFCLDRGISRDAYFYWQRKLRESACVKLSSSLEIPETTPSGWLQLSDAEESKSTLAIEISGCQITVDHKTDPELLKSICRILRTLG